MIGGAAAYQAAQQPLSVILQEIDIIIDCVNYYVDVGNSKNP
jgi:hypothetical protein